MADKPLYVVTVLWTGDFRKRDYSIKDLKRLKHMVDRNLNYDAFVCVTNTPADVAAALPGVVAVPIEHDLKGWWPKLQLFTKDFPISGRALYLDIDTLITGSLEPIVHFDAALAFMPPIPPGNAIIGEHLARAKKDAGKHIVTRFQSSVFVWDVGDFVLDIDDLHTKGWLNRYRGDQDIFGKVFAERAQIFPAYWFEKIKTCFSKGPRRGVRVVLGNPKHLWHKAVDGMPWVQELF